MRCILLTIIFSVFSFNFSTNLYANNIDISAGSLLNRDTAADTYDIKFHISWENSWRVAGAPLPSANWDAAWVFVKFSKQTAGVWQPWAHCTLKNTGNVVPTGSVMDFADNTDDPGSYKGVFMYRDAVGSGTNTWTNAQVRWDYGADGVNDTDPVKIQIFAVEMVYVPEGSFLIGDVDSDNTNNFRPLGGTGPVQITNMLSGAVTVNINTYDDSQLEITGIRIDGDDGLDTNNDGVVDNTLFPTGYNAFYLMKYEITQKQYVDFLNTLTGVQQSILSSAVTAGKFLSDVDTNATPQYRGGIKCVTGPVGATPGVYANDLNTGNAINSLDDGQWLAANWLYWREVAAYADWTALRPMTELEFVKAARGPKVPVDDEYAWGSASITQTTGLSNAGTASELPANGTANCAYGNHGSVQGPVRVGMYATATSTRQQSGSSYYGVMELSGNLWEFTVTVGNGTPNSFGGRDFTGLHGDGVLDVTGCADVDLWPGDSNGRTAGGVVSGIGGSGIIGGTWSFNSSYAQVSTRIYAANSAVARLNRTGGRCARTAP